MPARLLPLHAARPGTEETSIAMAEDRKRRVGAVEARPLSVVRQRTQAQGDPAAGGRPSRGGIGEDEDSGGSRIRGLQISGDSGSDGAEVDAEGAVEGRRGRAIGTTSR